MSEKSGRFGPLIGAIDEGTATVKFLVFAAKTAEVLTYHQVSLPYIRPKEGWVEQDPDLILKSVIETIDVTCDNLNKLEIDPSDIVAVGLTNQRETTIVWDSVTGKPLYNAIVWLDMRTSDTVDQILQGGKRDKNFLKLACGLPVSTYFSAVKLKWLIDNVKEVQKAIANNRCLFGTVDSWLIWNLTGGVNGGLHVTDVTNASRSMLVNLETLKWDPQLCKIFKIPMNILPEIRSSSEIYGYLTMSYLKGIPISGCLGDQQAALVGQMCLQRGQTKCSYGTGCFLLCNTGTAIVHSEHGLLTTVAYQLGKNKPPVFALEGSVAVGGAAMKWLKDNMNVIPNVSDAAELAKGAGNESEVYFVPAFSGLYAPYWRKDAKSLICGVTEQTKPGHIVRAALEAVAFQIRDIIDALRQGYGSAPSKLLVDGGMSVNDFLMQIQADFCGITIVRPLMSETAASLGAAMVAGFAKGIEVWDFENILPVPSDIFVPSITEEQREVKHMRWKMAVDKSLDWTNKYDRLSGQNKYHQILKSLPGSLFLMGSFIMLVVADMLSNESIV